MAQPNQLPLPLVLEKLKPLLEDPAVVKIGHNLKYDWVMFDKAGIDVAPYDDTMLMSFDLDAGRSFGHNLTDLAKSQFEHDCISFKSLCGTGAKQITLAPVALASATAAAAALAAAGEPSVGTRIWRNMAAPCYPA